jgi:dipeptidase E
LTAFHGEPRRVRGLGLLPHSNCVHYDGEPVRRDEYRAAVGRGDVSAGYAADDGVALHFIGTDLARVVSSRRDKAAYRVEAVEGEAMEVAIEPTYLGAAPPLAVA